LIKDCESKCGRDGYTLFLAVAAFEVMEGGLTSLKPPEELFRAANVDMGDDEARLHLCEQLVKPTGSHDYCWAHEILVRVADIITNTK
jgi:hypothetical protein